ncbi:MAG: 50S ribosomal protein L24e [Candidatus Bathyarchaeia archaeon]
MLSRVRKCSFCGSEIPVGCGLMYVKRDGTIQWFCSRKCRVSMLEFHRDPRKLKWTEYHGKKERGS